MLARNTVVSDSPPPGDSEVISHFERLSSKETKIAPRSVRIAVKASDRVAVVKGMLIS
jgi:hypothetical protein